MNMLSDIIEEVVKLLNKSNTVRLLVNTLGRPHLIESNNSMAPISHIVLGKSLSK